MALDRQKILSELGSVMSQLQSANCGCLGGLFEKRTPSAQYSSHVHAPPSCGGHHHSCHARPSYSASCSNNHQRHGHCMSNCNPQKLFTDGTNYINKNIVEPTVKEVYEELKSISSGNTVANSPLALQMGLPCSPAMPQGAQQGSGQNFVNIADKKPNFVNKPENGTDNNQSYQSFNEINNKGAASTQNSYEQHAQGLAKFNKMFPGMMGPGDLGFDPMKVAIQMRAMDKNNIKEVRKPVNNNYEVPKLHPGQQSNAPHTPNLNNSPDNTYVPTNFMPIVDSSPNLMPMNAPNNPYNNQVPAYSENFHNIPMHHNDQQVHYAVSGQPLIQKQDTNEKPNHMQHQPPIDLSTVSNFFKKSPINPKAQPVTQTNPETANFNHNLCPPIYPADPYKSQPNTPPKLHSYENNILGQPIEMLPANVYHYPEPNLPQTLSPNPLKSRYSNVKSTISKTSLTGTKPVGRTISRNRLQRMYNEYRKSQSFIPPKPTPQGVTHSEGQLNVTNPNYNVDKFLERTGGDTELNKEIIQKIEAVGQLGDVPASNDLNNNITEKLSPDTGSRAVRNGLQDIVFTSYPTSTAWSFHGTGR